MRIRVAVFVGALLLLPPLGLSLSGQEWTPPKPIAGALWLPALGATFALLVCALLLDALTFRRTHHSLLRSQRGYLLWSGVAGAIACLLIAYLNLFADAWFTPAPSPTLGLLVAVPVGAALLPTVLIVRLWLAGLPGIVRWSTRLFPLPSLPDQAVAGLMALAGLAGLLTGPVWMGYLGWLFCLSPLLLLVALQLLWGEGTVFSGMAHGDWSRVLLGCVSGMVAGGFALATYRLSGGAIYLTVGGWQAAAGLAIFGLLCLQIGDIVAEPWRGKPRGEVFKRKPFPIPIVTKKKDR